MARYRSFATAEWRPVGAYDRSAPVNPGFRCAAPWAIEFDPFGVGISATNKLTKQNGLKSQLGRPADASGLSYWLQAFAKAQTNQGVVAGFAGSAEYYDDHTS